MSVSKKDYNFAEQFYSARGIKQVPFLENERIISQTKAIAKMIQKDIYSFTRPNILGYTIRDNNNIVQFYGLKDTYNRVIEEALVNISQGKETMDESLRKILTDIGGSGLKKIDYKSGRSVRLDAVARMHLKDGLRLLHNSNEEIIGEEIGANMIEVTHHSNSAPDHIDTVDGKQFAMIDKIKEQIKNGTEKEIKLSDIKGNAVRFRGKTYKDFDDVNNSLKRQVSTLNCYHFTFTGILGISKPQYTEEQLEADKKRNEKGFEYEGKHYTMYEGTQLQRSIEREIRKQKDIQILAKASGDDELVLQAQQKITQLTNKYKELSDVSGLPPKIKRLQVVGFKKVAKNKLK